jgi:hypothetical protein
VSRALTALTRWLGYKGARVRHVLLPAGEGGAKTGLDDWLAAGNRAAQLEEFAEDPGRPEGGPLTSATSATRATDIPVVQWDGDLGGLLDDILAFTGRFTVYPSEAAHVAHVLWIAHTHQMQAWESTPRIAFLSPEPASGKTRTLEVTELLVPRPVEAVNTTPAYLFRRVADPAGLPTLLYDEVDTVFGPKAKDNEEIRGLLNAGHRRGAVAGRALKQGDRIVTEELPAYCALALAGIGALPDTVLSRSVVVRMRRRARGEKVEPFRRRMAVGAGLARAGPCSGCSACSGFPRAGQRKPGCPFACRPAADLRRGRGHVYERHPVGA